MVMQLSVLFASLKILGKIGYSLPIFCKMMSLLGVFKLGKHWASTLIKFMDVRAYSRQSTLLCQQQFPTYPQDKVVPRRSAKVQQSLALLECSVSPMRILDLSSMVVRERYDLKDQGQSQVTHNQPKCKRQSIALLSEWCFYCQVTKPTLTLTPH